MELKDAVKSAAAKRGGSDGHLGFASGLDRNNKSGKRILCEALIELTEKKKVSWIVSGDKKALVCHSGNLVLFLHESGGGFIRYTTDKTRHYSLRVFDEKQEIFSGADTYSQTMYDSNSDRMPIMDLWDMATEGKRREILPAHVCGMHGYGAAGDTCARCEYDREHRV